MHMPSKEIWQEMLRTPQIVRFSFPDQDGKRYPTLIIKAHSLLLKYITQGVLVKLFFFSLSDGHFAYGLYVEDDHDKGACLWSILSNQHEFFAIEDLVKNEDCTIFLFNETCASCAWTTAKIDIDQSVVSMMKSTAFVDLDPIQYQDEVLEKLECLHKNTKDIIETDVLPNMKWKTTQNHFIQNGQKHTTLNLLVDNEGTYQEQLAQTLLGDLSPQGAYLNTQLHDAKGNKEFTDVVLTYEYGTILLESKSLSILQRDKLPDRIKLIKNIEKSTKKALKQLRGAVKKLQNNATIFDEHGKEVELERQMAPHSIILVPELALLADSNAHWWNCMIEFMEETGGYLHFLDTVQLFRIMQAANMIAEVSQKSTPMMAFDYYLMERPKILAQYRSITVDVLLNLSPVK